MPPVSQPYQTALMSVIVKVTPVQLAVELRQRAE